MITDSVTIPHPNKTCNFYKIKHEFHELITAFQWIRVIFVKIKLKINAN
jgi:hypothetical protein